MPLPQDFPFIGLFGAHSSAKKINNYTTQYVCVCPRASAGVHVTRRKCFWESIATTPRILESNLYAVDQISIICQYCCIFSKARLTPLTHTFIHIRIPIS